MVNPLAWLSHRRALRSAIRQARDGATVVYVPGVVFTEAEADTIRAAATAQPTIANDWTPEDLAAESTRRDQLIDVGQCPDSGYTIARCQAVDLCDCFLPRADPAHQARELAAAIGEDLSPIDAAEPNYQPTYPTVNGSPVCWRCHGGPCDPDCTIDHPDSPLPERTEDQ